MPESEDPMTQPIDRNQDFYRIQRLPPYIFAEVNAMKAAARGAGQVNIYFDEGNPDTPSPQRDVDKLSGAGVAVSPRLGFGEYGEVHVRIAMVGNSGRIRQAARTVKRFLWASQDVHRREGVQVAAG